jgi:hypothetical protein
MIWVISLLAKLVARGSLDQYRFAINKPGALLTLSSEVTG